MTKFPVQGGAVRYTPLAPALSVQQYETTSPDEIVTGVQRAGR